MSLLPALASQYGGYGDAVAAVSAVHSLAFALALGKDDAVKRNILRDPEAIAALLKVVGGLEIFGVIFCGGWEFALSYAGAPALALWAIGSAVAGKAFVVAALAAFAILALRRQARRSGSGAQPTVQTDGPASGGSAA